MAVERVLAQARATRRRSPTGIRVLPAGGDVRRFGQGYPEHRVKAGIGTFVIGRESEAVMPDIGRGSTALLTHETRS